MISRRELINERQRQRYHATPKSVVQARQRAAHRKMKYGVTQAQWDKLFEAQGRRCAICRCAKPPGKTTWWCTDHDHNTKKIRGILCATCNRHLGVLERMQFVMAASDYLEKHT